MKPTDAGECFLGSPYCQDALQTLQHERSRTTSERPAGLSAAVSVRRAILMRLAGRRRRQRCAFTARECSSLTAYRRQFMGDQNLRLFCWLKGLC